MTLKLSPEAMKALSQNLGHADVLTTFTSYGQVPAFRQGELIRSLDEHSAGDVGSEQVAALEALLAGMKAGASPAVLSR